MSAQGQQTSRRGHSDHVSEHQPGRFRWATLLGAVLFMGGLFASIWPRYVATPGGAQAFVGTYWSVGFPAMLLGLLFLAWDIHRRQAREPHR